MSNRADDSAVIGSSTRVQLGILIVLFGSVVGAALSWSRLDGRVARIEEKLGDLVDEIRMDRANDWTLRDQEHFQDVFETANPGIKVPRPKRNGG